MTAFTLAGLLAAILVLAGALYLGSMALPHATVGVSLHEVMTSNQYAPGVYVVLLYKDEYDVIDGPLDAYMTCREYIGFMHEEQPKMQLECAWKP